jgi:protein involved in polysaccharide export with SLBB domain
MPFRSRRAFGALALVLSLGFSAQAQDGVDAAAKRTAETRVRPGDRITLHFMRDRELSDSLVVTERGDAAFPKIGVLQVSQMTIAQLQDTLRTLYGAFLRVPEFQIAVLRRVVVNGEVRVPSVYLIDGTSTVRDVIARAGGVTEAGNRKNVAIVREGHRIPVKDWDQAIGSAGDLQSGDQIVVGRKNWLVMNALPAISTAILATSFIISMVRR